MTALTPYASMDAGRFSAWGAFSAGSGDMKLMPEGGAAVEADIDLRIGAAGLRGELMDLAAGAACRWSPTPWRCARCRRGGRAAGGQIQTSRVRAAVEASWSRPLADGGRFSARLEGGARLDGGGAEEGLGAEVSAGLSWTAMPGGLSFELEGRHLVAHEDGDFSRTGASAHLSWDCGPDGLGRRLRCASAGASPRQRPGPIVRHAPHGQFGAESGAGGLDVGFRLGLALPGGRFLATPSCCTARRPGQHANAGLAHEALGRGRHRRGPRHGPQVTRRTGAAANDEHGILLEARLGF